MSFAAVLLEVRIRDEEPPGICAGWLVAQRPEPEISSDHFNNRPP